MQANRRNKRLRLPIVRRATAYWTSKSVYIRKIRRRAAVWLNDFPKTGKMGMTGEETKARPEYQAAKRRYEQSLTAAYKISILAKNSAAIKAARKAGDCEVELDADCAVEMDAEVEVSEEELKAAVAAGRKELEHQKKALAALTAKDSRAIALDRAMHHFIRGYRRPRLAH